MKNFFPDEDSTIAVALSGGIDSGVAAKILVKKGYKVVGFWMWLFGKTKGEGYKSASRLADFLSIPFYILDLRTEFKQRVMDYFVRSYELGETPNPCVVCNRMIKFGAALKWVQQKLKVDYLATGHYARLWRVNPKLEIINSKQKRECVYLYTAKDEKKDQSYFLYAIEPKILDRLVFPLGDMTKDEVRKKALKWKLPVAKIKESKDICFAKDWKSFTQKNIKNTIKKGVVLNTKGQKIGGHAGLMFYTIGQRAVVKSDKKFKSPRTPKHYVVRKDVATNSLVVGSQKDAGQKKFKIKDVNRPLMVKKKDLYVWIKVRSAGKLLKGKIQKSKGKTAFMELTKPALGIASGQSAVLYQKKGGSWIILGGGVVDK